jgi:hypothetical protein
VAYPDLNIWQHLKKEIRLLNLKKRNEEINWFLDIADLFDLSNISSWNSSSQWLAVQCRPKAVDYSR